MTVVFARTMFTQDDGRSCRVSPPALPTVGIHDHAHTPVNWCAARGSIALFSARICKFTASERAPSKGGVGKLTYRR